MIGPNWGTIFVIWANLLLIYSRVCSKGITEIFLQPQWIIESTWKITQREEKNRHGSFTLKKKDEIEGLTKHVDHTRTSLFLALVRVLYNLYNNAWRAGSQSSSAGSSILNRGGGNVKKKKHFLFLQRTSSPLALSQIYSRRQSHIYRSIHKYTQLVMLTCSHITRP